MIAYILIFFIMYFIYLYLTEGFNLDDIKNELRAAYQIDNPQIQYSVNPVPYLLDLLKARNYYPQTLPRRPDSIINPMRESILRYDSTYNTGNLPPSI